VSTLRWLPASRRSWVIGIAACAASVLLTACAAAPGPVGAQDLSTKKALGATEQLPGAKHTDDDIVVGSVKVQTTRLDTQFTCPPQTASPSTSNDLKKALRDAKPGDSILLSTGVYSGHFEITSKGTNAKPIYLCGPEDAVINGNGHLSGYALHFDGAQNWRLDGFTVRQGLKGIMVDNSSRIVLQAMTVADTGNEAVHLRDNSTNNVVRGLTIRKTGISNAKFGEGIYVGSAKSNWCDISNCGPDRSDNNQLVGNRISNTTAESIDIKEGTTGGLISNNQFDGLGMTGDTDSWVDVKGDNWTITGNHGQNSLKDGFQTHVILNGWGTGNVFTKNVAELNGGKGVGFYLHKLLTNRVSCNNSVSGALGGLSNDPCRG
jgi:hypothetical protein